MEYKVLLSVSALRRAARGLVSAPRALPRVNRGYLGSIHRVFIGLYDRVRTVVGFLINRV